MESRQTLRASVVAILLAVVLMTAVGGCARSLISGVQRQAFRTSRVEFDLPALGQEFATCMTTFGCPCANPEGTSFCEPRISRRVLRQIAARSTPAARQLALAKEVFDDKVHQQLISLCRQFAEGRTDACRTGLDLGFDGLLGYAGKIERSVTSGAWQELADAEELVLADLKDELQRAEGEGVRARLRAQIREQRALARVPRFISSYLLAYFRDGRIVEVTLSLKDVARMLREELIKRFPFLEDDVQALADMLRKELIERLPAFLPDALKKDLLAIVTELMRNPDDPDVPDGVVLTKLGTGGFVSRAGEPYRFPGIALALDPMRDEWISIKELDFKEIGAEVVRVFLEALFDAILGVPGTAESTGVLLGSERSNFLADDHLPRYTCPGCGVTPKQLEYVNKYAKSVEGAVSSAAGRLIRGVSWFSLNNEYIAVLFETMLGVTARKVSEKVIWCAWYAVNGGKDCRPPAPGQLDCDEEPPASVAAGDRRSYREQVPRTSPLSDAGGRVVRVRISFADPGGAYR